ncbi:MAG TPA: 3-deoxy-D-manno-octulosonic acid transferase [Pirellulales bacterium]|nr:3-deoxy-D-manno-octulosonic acid transferase [Pirellulales bacterium]
MAFFLNFAYLLTLLVAAPWLIYQSIFRGKYREGFAAKFLGAVPVRNSSCPCIWLHAVSVGEVNLLGVLLNEIAQRRPDLECIISTTTKTGFDLAKTKYSSHTVFYCPLDFTWAVHRAMVRIRPALLLLAELELWPNLVRAAHKHGARVAIMNGRLSEKSFHGYRRIRRWLAPVLNSLDLIAVQNEEYAQRFLALGVDPKRVNTTGSLKFDGAQMDCQNSCTQALRKLVGFSDDDVIFLAGSTQSPEEQLALAAFQSLAAEFPKLHLVMVPRHPHRFDEVAALLECSGVSWTRRSALKPTIPQSQVPIPHSIRILLVDTVGELGAWWGTASIGFVGGSLHSNRGGQNMIEPAAYGVATCFGPNTNNFRDVVSQLLAHDAAVRVHSGEQLTDFVRRCLSDFAYANDLGRNAAELVKAQQGATTRTWALIEPLLASSVIESQPFRSAA